MTDAGEPARGTGVDFESITSMDVDVPRRDEPITSLNVIASDNTGDIIERKHFVEGLRTSGNADGDMLNINSDNMIVSKSSVSPDIYDCGRFTAALFDVKPKITVVSDLKRTFSDTDQTTTETSTESSGDGVKKRMKKDLEETCYGEAALLVVLDQDRSTLEEAEFTDDALLGKLQVSFQDEIDKQLALFLGELGTRWQVPAATHGGTEEGSRERATDSLKRKDFNCFFCGLGLASRDGLKFHEMRHTNTFPYRCQHCGKGFARKYKLKAHTYIHTGTSPFSCNQCGKHLNSRSNLRRHEGMHLAKMGQVNFPPSSLSTEANEEKTAFEAQASSLALAADQSLTRNMERCSKVKLFTCQICNRSYSRGDGLRRHKLIHSGVCFQCDFCGRSFGDKSNMRRHRLIHGEAKSSRGEACGGLLRDSHPGGETPVGVLSDSDNLQGRGSRSPTSVESAELPQRCATLGPQNQTSDFAIQGPAESSQELIQSNQRLSLPSQETPHPSTSSNDAGEKVSYSTLKDHKTKESCNNPQDCSVYVRSLTFSNIGAKNEKTLTKQLGRISCQTCGASFASLSNLRRHQLAEMGGDPFKCDMCGRLFAQARYLQSHVRIHTGEKPYVCPTCGRGFRRSSNLSSHKKVHSRNRPYHCTTCDWGFLRSSDLAKHELTHKDVPDFACDICGIGHTSKRSLVKHRKRHADRESDMSGNACGGGGRLSPDEGKHDGLEVKADEAEGEIPPEVNVFLERQLKQELLRSD